MFYIVLVASMRGNGWRRKEKQGGLGWRREIKSAICARRTIPRTKGLETRNLHYKIMELNNNYGCSSCPGTWRNC